MSRFRRFRGYGDTGSPVDPASAPTLSPGDQGSGVQVLQQDLINLGYSVGATGADGVFGPATESALLSYQAASGIPTSGIADLATWTTLSSTMGVTIPTSNLSFPGLGSGGSSSGSTSLIPSLPSTIPWKTIGLVSVFGVGGGIILWGLVRAFKKPKTSPSLAGW